MLDDEVWAAFECFLERRPGGFRIAPLMRPPDSAAGESEDRWLERARAVAATTPFGLHTHWTSPTHARPTGGDPARRVHDEIEWLRTRDLRPSFFCGGGWYTDEAVRAVVREAGLVDCTATTFELPSRGSRVVPGPAPGLLPATHTVGMASRALRLGNYVHVYFHDTDLVRGRRAAALRFALAHIGMRTTVSDLDQLAAAFP